MRGASNIFILQSADEAKMHAIWVTRNMQIFFRKNYFHPLSQFVSNQKFWSWSESRAKKQRESVHFQYIFWHLQFHWLFSSRCHFYFLPRLALFLSFLCKTNCSKSEEPLSPHKHAINKQRNPITRVPITIQHSAYVRYSFLFYTTATCASFVCCMSDATFLSLKMRSDS